MSVTQRDRVPAAVMERARATPLTRPALIAFSAEHAAETLEAALADAVHVGGLHAGTVLAFALVHQGRTLPLDVVLALVPEVERIEAALALLNAATGDPLDVLLAILDSRRCDADVEVLALLMAAEKLEGRAVPAALVSHARRLTRAHLASHLYFLLGHVADRFDDAHLSDLAGPWMQCAREGASVIENFTQLAGIQGLEGLPEREAPRLVQGYTVKAAPAVGRNDPCPCGSGKKYKKCCALAPPAPEPAARWDENTLTPEQIRRFPSADLGGLQASRLSTQALSEAFRSALHAQKWALAETFLTEMYARPDVDAPHGWRVDLIDAAIEARARDVVEHHLAHLPDIEVDDRIRLRLDLLRRPPDLLERLDAAARRALETDDYGGPVELAYGMLEHFPALGILLARGAISERRLLDSDTLLRVAEEARDRLLLPPYEPWWDVYESILELPRAASGTENDPEKARLRAEIEQTRKHLDTTAEEARRLQRELERVEAALRAPEERASADGPKSAAESREDAALRVRALEEERRRLSTKVQELKSLVREGTEERRALRHQLAKVSDTAGPVRREVEPGVEVERDPDETGAWEPLERAHRGILIPEFDANAAKALEAVARDVASLALATVAELAAGHANTWHGVKQLKRVTHVWSARSGIHYRLLFSVEGGRRLRVIDLVHRRDLETAVARLG